MTDNHIDAGNGYISGNGQMKIFPTQAAAFASTRSHFMVALVVS
jgi:hypothetical protein